MTSLEMRAFWHGQDQARHEARIAAFGAIRRAAGVARHWQNDQEEICGEAAAFYIRQAIRAAIGSPKA